MVDPEAIAEEGEAQADTRIVAAAAPMATAEVV
jgi:hypothetical protein